MVEDDSKKNGDGSSKRSSKTIKDMNRELRTKIVNISKSLLTNRPKKAQRSQIIRLDPALFARSAQSQLQNAAMPVTKNEVIISAPPSKPATAPAPVQDRKKDTTLTPQNHAVGTVSSNEKLPAALSRSCSGEAVQKGNVPVKKKREIDAFDFSTSSKSESHKHRPKATPEKKFSTKKPKMKKIYTENQLKKMINKLYKQTKEIRAADPAVDELLRETRESIRAIEQLEKLFIHIHEESKARTKKIVDDFEKLKNMRIRHGRELDTQIAQQVRAELDAKKELIEMLNDDNVKMLMAKTSKRREHPEQQRSFIVRMLRRLVGL